MSDAELGGKGGTIGGSIVAQILGVSPYGGQHDAWVRIVKGRDIPDNEAMERGRRLEPWVAEVAAEALGMRIEPPFKTTSRFSGEFRLSYSIDFEAYDKAGKPCAIVEIKTSGDRRRWPEGGHPEHRLQVQHYLAGRDLDVGYIVGVQASAEVFRFIHSPEALRYALENGCARLHVETVKRDPRYTKEVIPFLLDWFETFVTTKTPPPADGSSGCTEALRVHFQGRDGETEATEEIESLARQYDEIKASIKESTRAKAEAENKLRELLGRHKSAESEAVRVTISEQPGRLRFDAKRFKEDHPELHQRYMVKGGGFDQLRIKLKQAEG